MWQTLQPELIFEVLSHFLPGLKLVAPRSSLFPWYLGHICKGWRSVFVSSPQFWSTFSLDLKGGLFYGHWKPGLPHLAFIERQIAFLDLCLERNRGFPISFNLVTLPRPASYSAHTQLLDLNRKIIEMVMAESTRWQDVNLTVNAFDLALLYQVKGQFSRLRSIRLALSETVHCFAAGPTNPFTDLFEDCQTLSRIHLGRFRDWSLNWSTMAAIGIHSLNSTMPHEFLCFLRQTRHLETLVLGQAMLVILPDDIDPVALPFLKHLSCDSVAFISFIRAPALEQLWLRNDIYPSLQFHSDESFNRYASTFFNSLPSEVEFVTLAPGLTNDDVRILYHCLTKVRCLHLRTDTVQHLRMFQKYFRHAWHVQTIAIALDFAQGRNVEEIVTALVDWVWGPGPLAFESLNKVTIDVYGSVPGSDSGMKRLKELYKQQNIQLEIRFLNTITIAPSLSPFWKIVDI
ncbi:hypothetical protein F5887DRAFT_1074827 [Amanita rubescens]|nr:hypothetical protein F5887DRAFT_281676 [Amanita rubescens]KAF8344899.1 hypothetical protein F5887DRAFT_1074827 [Amanita rubescens]